MKSFVTVQKKGLMATPLHLGGIRENVVQTLVFHLDLHCVKIIRDNTG